MEFGETALDVVGELSGKLGLLLILCLVALSVNSMRSFPRSLAIFGLCVVTALALGLRPTSYAAGQVLLDLKLPLAIIGALGFVSDRLFSRRLELFFVSVLALSLVLVVLLFASPEAYHQFFPRALITTTITGTQIRRAVGAFVHPGLYAVFSAIALLYFVAVGSSRGWNPRIKLGIVLAILSLVSSGQRLESLAALTMMTALYIIVSAKHPLRMSALLLVGFVGLLFAGSGITSALETANANFSGQLDENETIPRVLLWNGAVRLANADFPVGSGLGTYGSSMSLVNPTPAYVRSGITAAWWYGKKSFLTDTYWAKVLGELGWFGAALMLFAYLFLLRGPVADIRQKAHPELAFSARLAFMVTGFFLLNSIAAPIYTGSALPILLMGTFYAYYLSVRRSPTRIRYVPQLRSILPGRPVL